MIEGLMIPDFTPEHELWIDFESFYDDEYQLRKMSTESYVRDERFETIGVSIDDGEERVWMEEEEFVSWAETVPWEKCAVGAHHIHFDGLILAHHYGIVPGFYLDSMSMGRALHGVGNISLEKLMPRYGVGQKGHEVLKAKGKRRKDFTREEWLLYGDYSMNDARGARGIYNKMIENGFPESELYLIDLIVRMFTDPVFILDEPLMTQFLIDERKRKQEMLERLSDTPKELRSILMSNEKFAQLLISLGVEPPRKISPTTKEETWAFAKSDPGMQNMLEHQDDIVRWLAEARVATKSTINETRTERFLRLGRDGQAMCVYLKQYGAHTGRLSGADGTNWQNLERTDKKKPEKGALRRSIRAPVGQQVVVADSAQIEARTTAWVAGDEELLAEFRTGADIYSNFASIIYQRHVDRKTNPDDFIPGFIAKCLGGDTPVLTKNGWVHLSSIRDNDLLWDGEEWVSHGGLVCSGVKNVTCAYGIAATTNHEFMVEDGWAKWYQLVLGLPALTSALNAAGAADVRKYIGANTLETEMVVYDIINAGPRHRFMIKTDAGNLIARNCSVLGLGYQMGYYTFAATLLRGMLGGPPVQFKLEDAEKLEVDVDRFTEGEWGARKVKRIGRMPSRIPLEERVIHCAVADKIVRVYRTQRRPIVELWETMGQVIETMEACGGNEQFSFGPNECLVAERHAILLPNGMRLLYPGLELRQQPAYEDEDGNIVESRSYYSYLGAHNQRAKLYGGLLTENVVQALARIIVTDQLLHMKARYGIRPATFTHDELIYVTPENEASWTLQVLLETMKTPPSWAKGLSLHAEGGFGPSYGQAKPS